MNGYYSIYTAYLSITLLIIKIVPFCALTIKRTKTNKFIAVLKKSRDLSKTNIHTFVLVSLAS